MEACDASHAAAGHGAGWSVVATRLLSWLGASVGVGVGVGVGVTVRVRVGVTVGLRVGAEVRVRFKAQA